MSKMNLPNKLTLLRLCLVPVIVIFLLLPINPYLCYAVGAVIFIFTAVTDMLDGSIARKHNLITNFGKFMDPVADKFMVIGTMMALLFRMLNPLIYGIAYETYYLVAFFVLLLMIIFREFAITSLRLVVVTASGEVVAANILGKLKTITQIVCIGAVMIEPLLDALITHFLPDYCLHGIYPITLLCMAVTLVLTGWSGYNYLKAGWKYISTDV